MNLVADTEQKGAGMSGVPSSASEVQPEPSVLGSLSEGADCPSVIPEFRGHSFGSASLLFLFCIIYLMYVCILSLYCII